MQMRRGTGPMSDHPCERTVLAGRLISFTRASVHIASRCVAPGNMLSVSFLAVLVFYPLLPSIAAAETAVKIGELTKAGYSCKEVGEARHLCTKGEKEPTYGCEEYSCTPIGRAASSRNDAAIKGTLLDSSRSRRTSP